MESIFDPVVEKILALVQGMLNDSREKEPSKPVVVRISRGRSPVSFSFLKLGLKQPIQGLILVGGFGESVYLSERLNSWAGAQSPPLIVGNPKDS
jgi:hypothetical protein